MTSPGLTASAVTFAWKETEYFPAVWESRVHFRLVPSTLKVYGSVAAEPSTYSVPSGTVSVMTMSVESFFSS